MAVTSAQQTPALFKPIKVGRITLQHRVVRAPLTHFRTYASHVPSSASILRRSHVNISRCRRIPGIFTDAQIQAWKTVTDAVRAKGSYIFIQLWALGRAANIEFLEKQDPPSPYVSASSVTMTGSPKPPRPLTEAEINDYIAAYAKAASNAVHNAGFDGVEIHSANGYLLDEYLQIISNKRTDRWGGYEEGRTRFTREVVDAIVDAVGEDRVGIRISPWSSFQDMKMPDPRPTFAYLVSALRDKHPKMA